jgi:hypothetical protein
MSKCADFMTEGEEKGYGGKKGANGSRNEEWLRRNGESGEKTEGKNSEGEK